LGIFILIIIALAILVEGIPLSLMVIAFIIVVLVVAGHG
jgi:hypothetical protein